MLDINVCIRDAISAGCLTEEYYIPRKIKATYNVYLSERNRAKTTTWLIVAIAAHVRYGTITHILRSRTTMIAESKIYKMFDSIRTQNYITKLSAGRWNDIEYSRIKRVWTLCNRDKDTCKIVEYDDEPTAVMMAVEQSELYKSGYTCTKADLVIYDEFQNNSRVKKDSIYFMDILSTLFRDRLGCKVIMLSNTLDKDDRYFDELLLRDFITYSDQGDSTLVVSPKGTKVYCELLDQRKIARKNQQIISEYFDLSVRGIEAITGEGWQIEDAKHIDPEREVERLTKNIYIYTRGVYLHCNIVRIKETSKIALYITPATHRQVHSDEIIYTRDLDNAYNTNAIIKDVTSSDPLTRYINKIIYHDDVYASDNTTAIRFKRYITNKE